MAILATLTSSRFVATLGIACVAAWGLACLTASQAFLRSAGRARAFLAVTAVAAVGSQASGLLAVFIWRTDLAFLSGWAFGQLVMVVVAWSVCRATGTVGPLMAELRPALQVALPTLPHSFALVAIVYTDRLVLGATVSAEAAGRYQLAYVVGASGLAMIGALNNLWAPSYYAQP
jgi:O-antigen/teichoic acid export membrane protein